MFRTLALSLFSLIIAGCAGHSIPPVAGYPSITEAAQVRAFVDANGSFYPAYWNQSFGKKPLKRHRTLLQVANNQEHRSDTLELYNLIRHSRVDQLAEIKRLAAQSKRVFVLVHGFNNRVDETAVPFDVIERAIQPRANDLVVRFHWDGMTATGLGSAKIWFNAVASSQLAGTRGLRAILNQIENRPVYLIAHSRGASVALSAMSDPPFSDGFLGSTAKITGLWPDEFPKLFLSEKLAENGNIIRMLLMAPAIGKVDFCDAAEGPGCERPREMTGQLCSVRYTLNAGDPVLRKFLGLGRRFNATDFGTDPAIGERLIADGATYLKPRPFSAPMKKHGFMHYVQHQSFVRNIDEMLEEPDGACAGRD